MLNIRYHNSSFLEPITKSPFRAYVFLNGLKMDQTNTNTLRWFHWKSVDRQCNSFYFIKWRFIYIQLFVFTFKIWHVFTAEISLSHYTDNGMSIDKTKQNMCRSISRWYSIYHIDKVFIEKKKKFQTKKFIAPQGSPQETKKNCLVNTPYRNLIK